MFEKLDLCPSCGHPKFQNHLICTDHSVSGESFALVRCDKCELIFTNPRPTIDQVASYYQSENYISHTNRGNNLVNRAYKIVRSITLRKKLKLLNSLTDKRAHLDFGCGTGHFLDFCEGRGWASTGVEPEVNARKHVESKLKGKIYNNIQSVKRSFDIITSWHVIEHVHDLNETLKQLSKRLEKNGFLVIALPNCCSFDAEHYKESWAGYDVPRHLYHFTKTSFNALIAKHKLSLIKTLPMTYDSYYVSLLSEKYFTGKNRFLSAVRTGRKSNVLAKKNGEYSSLIYVLSK